MRSLREGVWERVALLAQSTDCVQDRLEKTALGTAVFEANERAAGRSEADIQASGVVEMHERTVDVCTNPAAEP